MNQRERRGSAPRAPPGLPFLLLAAIRVGLTSSPCVRSCMASEDQALIAHWEARLASEGLTPIPDGCRWIGKGISLVADDDPTILEAGDRASEPTPWGPAPPSDDEVAESRARLAPLVARLPEHLAGTMRLRLAGKWQREIAEIEGVSQVSISLRLRAAERALTLLARHPLLMDLGALQARVQALPMPEYRGGPRTTPSALSDAVTARAQHWADLPAASALGIAHGTLRGRCMVAIRQAETYDPELHAALAAMRGMHLAAGVSRMWADRKRSRQPK